MHIRDIALDTAVQEARSLVLRGDRETVEEQARIAAIPAPSGSETARGSYLCERFAELGCEAVVDEVGNVLGLLGAEAGDSASGAPIVVAAHLDTVFPAGTDVRVRFDGDRIQAPGITDNARGLAAMLAVVRSLRGAAVSTGRPVIFAATVGEEGIGDLRGMKHLFRKDSALRGAAAVLVVDGAGETRIVTRAVGAIRIKASFEGRGGHSWGDRGRANPAHAAARAIAEISGLTRTGDHPYAVTVGRIGGGTSVNSIPAETWFELDLRSDDAPTLEWLEEQARRIIENAAADESDRSKKGIPASAGTTRRSAEHLRARIERIGSRPCGVVGREEPVVRVATAVTTFLGLKPEYVASSTDANVPISLGIPAVAIGAGGRAGGVHTLDEWFENRDGPRGIERVLLTVLAFAGVQGFDPLV